MNSLTQEFVQETFSYNANTGDLRWKDRPLSHFPSHHGMKTINARQAGKLVSGSGILTISGKPYPTARVAWCYSTGEWPEWNVCRVDKDKANNRSDNLMCGAVTLKDRTHYNRSFGEPTEEKGFL